MYTYKRRQSSHQKAARTEAGMQLVGSECSVATCFPFSSTLLSSAAADNMTATHPVCSVDAVLLKCLFTLAKRT